ncbi:MAG TPA: hypothetical protein VKU85_06750, partial [bacterium]|nr:hypothetical protein [bacterium]
MPTPRALLGPAAVAALLGALAAGPVSDSPDGPAPFAQAPEGGRGPVPNEWFLVQRAWPQDDVRTDARLEAYEQARVLRAEAAALRSAAAWTPVGPTNVGGRIADLVCHPTNPNVCWAGAAEGGVMKTTDGGQTWIPKSDFESSLSMGDLAIDPTNPQILYAGTGEPNGGGGSVTYGGTGVLKSTDGGDTWTITGLPDSRFIGRVAVSPGDPDQVFVAALGSLFSPSPDRGVYRSTDAGGSWQQVLALNDTTGAVDVAVHPTDPDVVYAAMWERLRAPDNIDYGGPSCGIWRSTDGGDTWSQLTNGLPSGSNLGRIGLAVAPSAPSTVYSIWADESGDFLGVYKSTNAGDSWTQTNDGALFNVFATFGWWFGQIRVSPVDEDVVFAVGYEVWRSTNGGATWTNVGSSMHVDHHALEFASNGDIYEGNDGGLYKSVNGGTVWSKLPDLAATQFYAIEVDESDPTRRYGGAQDNGTNRTLTGASDNWTNILGGDGFAPLVNPVDNSYVYAQAQYGALYRSTNGGSSFSYAAGQLTGRINWSMPIVFDPSDPSVLYAGTDRVFRSTNHAAGWSAISADLTDGAGAGNRVYGTITTLAVAPSDPDVIWAGTDDAHVWVTTNGGSSWTQVGLTLPQRWITRVAVDPAAANVSYVTLSGFRWDEPYPHVFRSTDYGASFQDISSNLPQAPVNDIVPDPGLPSVLYVATDTGVYVTTNLGLSWSQLGTGLPNVVVSDLRLHEITQTLYAGTYGRSMWSLPLASVVVAAGPAVEGGGGALQLGAPFP